MGVLSTLRADNPSIRVIGYPIILGVGCGIQYAATYFPVLAPLPISQNAHALAFFSFCRSFAAVSKHGLLAYQRLKAALAGLGNDYRDSRIPDPADAETPGGVHRAISRRC